MSSSISLPVRVRTLGGGGLVSFIFLRFWFGWRDGHGLDDLLSCSLKPSDILLMSASLRIVVGVRCIVTLEERSEEGGIRGRLIAMVEQFVFD